MSQEIENNFEERKKDWDLTGLLDDVIRRYIYQLTNDELNEINLEKASGMPDEEIKNGIKLPLATMQQRRETWGSQSKLDVQEPMIFILQSTVEKLSVGDKIPLSDADSFLIHQESGVLNYELHYLMNGTPQEYNAFLDLSKVKVADTLMDGVTHSTPPALSDYLERHQQLNDTELGAKRLQKLNCDSKNVSYAKYSWIPVLYFYFLVPAVVRMTPRKLSVKCWVLPQSKRHPVVFHTVKTEAAAQATIACSVRLWMQMKLHKWIKTVASFFHLQVNQSSTKNISHSMIPLI